VQDNHKPVFTNCSQYAPTVKEEEPSDTYVFTVKAVDKDPPEAGGTITYTFVSAPGERLKFSIDPESGVIKTRHVSAAASSVNPELFFRFSSLLPVQLCW
jgi:hypothetical protein